MKGDVMEKVGELYELQMELDDDEKFSSLNRDLEREVSRIVQISEKMFYTDVEEVYVYELMRECAVDVERAVFKFIAGRDEIIMRSLMSEWRWDLYGDIMEKARELSVVYGHAGVSVE